MPVTITRAMVLAAGLGLRMRPLTDMVPKPLVRVAGRTLIDHALDRLKGAGVKEVVVNVHYKAELLRAHLALRSDLKVAISDESDRLLDSGGGVKKALAHFKGEPFFTLNSDSMWSEGLGASLHRMMERWRDADMDALMLLAATTRSIGYDGRGDFTMDSDGRLTRRDERRVAPFVWTGVQIVHPRLFEGAPDGPFSTNRLWDKAAAKDRLFGMRHDGTWMHVGTVEAIAEAEGHLRALALTP